MEPVQQKPNRWTDICHGVSLYLQLGLRGRQRLGRRLSGRWGCGEIHPKHSRAGPTVLFIARLDLPGPPCPDSSPQRSCSLVKAGTLLSGPIRLGERWLFLKNQQVTLPLLLACGDPALAARGVRRGELTLTFALGGNFLARFQSCLIRQLTLCCMLLPKGHIHRVSRQRAHLPHKYSRAPSCAGKGT